MEMLADSLHFELGTPWLASQTLSSATGPPVQEAKETRKDPAKNCLDGHSSSNARPTSAVGARLVSLVSLVRRWMADLIATDCYQKEANKDEGAKR